MSPAAAYTRLLSVNSEAALTVHFELVFRRLNSALFDATSVSGLQCDSLDNGGGELVGTLPGSSTNGVPFALLCFYSDQTLCAYSSDGSFNTEQSIDPDNVCPESLTHLEPPPPATSPTSSPRSSTSSEITATAPEQTSSPTSPQPSSANTERSPTPSQTLASKTSSGSPSQSTPGPSSSSIIASSSSSGQLPSPTGVQVGSTSSDRNRNKTRTAAIAASVLSVFLLAGLLFLVLWLKRRRPRSLHDKEGTPSSPNSTVGPDPLPTDKPIAGSSSPPVERESTVLSDTTDRADDEDRQPRPASIAALDVLPDEKFGETPSANTSSGSDSTPADSGGGIPSNDANTRPDDSMHQDETLALRVQRMEAQLNALLAMGVGSGAPPSYTG
ncbi:hypothetical protein MVEN_00715800 [Mycena venus]|uniref:Uncharacterized protein n=1 Tax=Mycena venus TaxID=2733690 RepID=A0A8H6YKE5_9AGAR|nr:hypothetical protein MVEN_00715800 [Mycena venus]